MIGVVAFMHFEADDLTAVDVQYQVQITPYSENLGGQVAHIPRPHLTWTGGHMGTRWPHAPRRLSTPPMAGLTVGSQHPTEAGFAGDVHTLVSQHRHDAGGWQSRKARLMRHLQD